MKNLITNNIATIRTISIIITFATILVTLLVHIQNNFIA